jgi:hypothetical protein
MEKWLFNKLRSRDSKTVEIYFQALNVWWLFVLWGPNASVALDISSPLYIYILGIWTGALIFLGITAMLSSKVFLRIGVILSYAIFYFLTGINLLNRANISSLLGGIFICQGVLATFLLWKVRAIEGTNKREHAIGQDV